MAEETFGQRLKRLREAAGLTQQQLGDLAGMNQFGVSKLERDVFVPSWTVVKTLARALGQTELAMGYERRFLDEFPRDSRAFTIRQRLQSGSMPPAEQP